MKDKSAVTTHIPFDSIDGEPLFSVNPGVPISDALERAADLMLYVETLAAADAFIDKAMESGVVQTLSEMANALLKASKVGVGKGKSSL